MDDCVPLTTTTSSSSDTPQNDRNDANDDDDASSSSSSFLYQKSMTIRVQSLSSDCKGSADALRQVTIDPRSHAVVMPGDLVLEGGGVLGLLADAHRCGGGAVAATVLLSDVGEVDEKGVLIKESAKQKKGGLGRDEEEMEYIALSSKTHRIILKQSKIDVDEADEYVGTTPKLFIPKLRLTQWPGGGPSSRNDESLTLRTDLSDLHVYALAPWILQLLRARTTITSVQKELLPLLISRQWREGGIASAFGSRCLKKPSNRQILDSILSSLSSSTTSCYDESFSDPAMTTTAEEDDGRLASSSPRADCAAVPFRINARIVPRGSRLALRACTIPSYLYACREVVHHLLQRPAPAQLVDSSSDADAFKSCFAPFPKGAKLMTKFNTVVLGGETTTSVVGDKVTLKSSTVGPNVTIGSKSKLNNVVVMEGAVVGEHCTLQNSVIGSGAVIGEGVSFNDVQVGFGVTVAGGVKLKGESVARG